jgi:hypothetical protein
MTGPGEALKRAQIVEDTRAEGVQVQIANEFQKINLLVDHDGFVAILEHVAGPLVTTIELSSIAGQERSHAPTYRTRVRPNQQMRVVRHEGPGVDCKMAGLREAGNPLDEIFPIRIVMEDDLAVQAPDHHMVQGAGCVEARSAWHDSRIPQSNYSDNVPISFRLLPARLHSRERGLQKTACVIDPARRRPDA